MTSPSGLAKASPALKAHHEEMEIPVVTIVAAYESIIDSAREMLGIARRTLAQEGTHFPTAVLHTMGGMVPMVLPFRDHEQRSALVAYVKQKSVELHAFAVSTITCARIVDSRTGRDQECLVVATTVQRGLPHVVVQHFARNEPAKAIEFGEIIEGDDAVMPGQMMIFPDWDEEICH